MSTLNITLYTFGTPNGLRASIAFEYLGIPYTLKAIDLSKGEQKSPEFLKISPQGRIPAIVDHSNGDFAVFESGAILLYLAQNYDKENKIWPKDPKLQSEVYQWLFFQASAVGPTLGQVFVWKNYVPEEHRSQFAIDKYTNDTKTSYKVLDSHLQGKEYFVGNQLTIADLIAFPWVYCGPSFNIDLKEFPNLHAWAQRLSKIPSIDKGLDVPFPCMFRQNF
jgi:glutathione S-transferase